MNLSINWTKSSVYTWLIRGWGQMKKGNPNFLGSTYFFLSSKQVNEINQNYLRPHFDRQPCKNPFFISIIINKTFVGVGSRTKIKYKVIHTYIFTLCFVLNKNNFTRVKTIWYWWWRLNSIDSLITLRNDPLQKNEQKFYVDSNTMEHSMY